MTIFEVVLLGIVAIMLLFGRTIIQAGVKAGVQHGFDKQLEAIKAEFQERAMETAATRQSILDGSGAHQRAVEARRLQAVDEIWKGLLVLKRHGTWAASVLSRLKIENVVPELDDPRTRTFVDTMFGSSVRPDEMGRDPDLAGAQQAQPWALPMAWATFAAYEAVVGAVVLQAQMLKLGLDPKQFYSQEKVDELVDLVLQGKNLKKITPLSNAILPQLLRYLESTLLEELRGSISGGHVDRQTVDRAKRVVELAAEVSVDVLKGQKESAA